MKTAKQKYEEPACKVVILHPQKVIATSPESLDSPDFTYGDALDLG